MNDNVFIFGAGTSFDAGIPLLRNFVERMWEIAVRAKINGVRHHFDLLVDWRGK